MKIETAQEFCERIDNEEGEAWSNDYIMLAEKMQEYAESYHKAKTASISKDQLITQQQLQIENYKKIIQKNEELKSELIGKFYNISQPLNDNVLQMNNKQMGWCLSVVELVEQLNIE